MELTGLEIIMGGAILSGGVGLGTWIISSARFQSRTACDERHASVCRDICAIKEKQSVDTGIIMRMLRSLIVHSDIPEAEKERILNDRAAK
jgi:hypothetical protein